jgi:polygalacturonase
LGTGLVFKITDYGALGDGQTTNTVALQKALDACAANGGGVVVVPNGIYLTGSIVLSSNTTLRLEKDAVIQGTDNLDDYPLINTGRWEGTITNVHRALIHAEKAGHLAIVGEGMIASGKSVGPHRNPRGPVVIELIDCQDVRLEGVTVKQHGVWTVHPTFCQDVLVRGVTFTTTGGKSDGIDVDSCQRVRIERCTFSTGDDCIAIKSGKGEQGRRLARTSEDIFITDCDFLSGNFAAVAMGSECSGGVRNVRIERCAFSNKVKCALRFKTDDGRGGFIEDITAKDLDVAGTFLQLTMRISSNHDPQPLPGPEGITRMANIRIENVKVHGGGTLVSVNGHKDKPVAGLVLANISGTCDKGITIRNATGVELRDIAVTGFAGPKLAIENVQGAGLEGAVEATPVKP